MTAAGCSGRWPSTTGLGGAGERDEPQAANGPEGESPIEQVERARWPSLTASRACGRAYITAQRIRYLSTLVGGSTRASVAGFLDPMTSPGTPLPPRVADVVRRCSSVVEPGIFLSASSCSSRPSADRHDAKIRQSGSGFSLTWRVVFSSPGGLPSMMLAH